MKIQAPNLQDSPLDSLSLKEFWAKRWDSVIQEILGTYVYLPLRRKNFPRSSATLLVFCVSGLIHVWPLFVAGLTLGDSLMMFSYFLSQFFFLSIESFLGVSTWTNQLFRRMWTLTVVAIPLSLIVLPSASLMA